MFCFIVCFAVVNLECIPPPPLKINVLVGNTNFHSKGRHYNINSSSVTLKQIYWLMLNANFSNISALSLSWREHWYSTWTNTIAYVLHSMFMDTAIMYASINLASSGRRTVLKILSFWWCIGHSGLSVSYQTESVKITEWNSYLWIKFLENI